MSELQVEVFPVEATRWIAVIEASTGPFSTEARSPALVADEVARVIREVLGAGHEHVLVDESGQPWSESVALQQVGRLAVQEGVGGRLTWWERAVLDALLALDFPDARVLRQQARSVVVTESCQCGCPTINLVVEDPTAPLWSVLGGRVQGEVRVPAQGRSLDDDNPFEVILWVRDGKLSLMEFVGTPGRRAAWPEPSAFDFWVG
ncbi:hypothetical protein [Cellulomonas sp. KRMCY2]|uniref:hypothetical protein n=1 Tax=Cellulomonas sp. KRMCY2 TaxID=1304865 RepID=UPI00045E8D2D|nr:hypothetical protein [Cellulomonas sp. KRMCY2]